MGMLAAARDTAKLAFGLGLLGVVCLGWAPLAWGLGKTRRADDGRLGRRVNSACLRFYLRMMERAGTMRFDIDALEALESDVPMIIAPNHPRLIDAFLVISRLTNVVCIMKQDLDSSPFLRHGARFAQYIGNDSPVQMIRDSVRTLKRGNHLLLFPEGTRTVREPVNPFTAAVGVIAAKARVPVQTVFIECDSPYMRKGWSLFLRPSLPITFRIRLGRRFDPPDDARAFTTMLERYFADELTALASTSPMAAKPARVRDALPANLARPT